MSQAPPDGGFLERWSRRKQQAARAETVPEPQPEVTPEEVLHTLPDTPGAEPEISAEEIARLPPLETIGRDTDLTVFLRKGVPQALRNAALRRMWSADPVIRDYVDVARDYAYDWNTGPGIPGFGPLSEGTDTLAMAERIFKGAAPEPENEPAAARGDNPVLPETSSEPPDTAAPPEPSVAQGDLDGKGEDDQTFALNGEAPDGRSVEGPRRRHGRAAPV